LTSSLVSPPLSTHVALHGAQVTILLMWKAGDFLGKDWPRCSWKASTLSGNSRLVCYYDGAVPFTWFWY